MDNIGNKPESDSLPTGVFEVPGEPAIIINGVPDVSPSDGTIVPAGAVNDVESHRNIGLNADFLGNRGLGEWLEGREVRKLFVGRYYGGIVTHFDKETGWYRVFYEDGDSEDLDWPELEEVLLPLDITIPLRSLSLRIIKKNQKTVFKSVQSVTESQIVTSGTSRARR